MVSIKVGTATKRKTVVVETSTTISEVIAASEMNMGTATMFLNGAPISNAEYDSTLEDLGVEDESEASLLAVVKADSAK